MDRTDEDRAVGDREPQPSDGPDFHADHAAWRTRRWSCPRCGSPRWVAASLNRGLTVRSLRQLLRRPSAMTPGPTLTDEELDTFQERLHRAVWNRNAHASTRRAAEHDAAVIIAALRASRADVERLRSEAREEYARAQQAEAALVAAKAEVERLRAVNTPAEVDHG